MPLTKINVPLDTPTTQTNNNYYGEVAKIQALAADTMRSAGGNVEWTSDTSQITYNTANYTSDSAVYNKGETGLMNLLIKLYGTNADSTKRFIMTADDWNEVANTLNNYATGTPVPAAQYSQKIGSGANSHPAIGNTEQPVYVNSDGVIRPATAYSNATVDTANHLGSIDVGDASTPIWLDNGEPKPCTTVAAATSINANVAIKLGTTTIGSQTEPIYLSNGVPLPCANISAGTATSAGTANTLATPRDLKVNLATTSAASFDGSADATGIGVSGVLPMANGGTGASAAKGSVTKPVYLGADGIAACTYSLSANVNSGTSGKLVVYGTNGVNLNNASGIGSATKPVYLNDGTPTACTYELKSTVNNGTANKLAYYSGTNAVSAYSSSVGAANRMIYLNAGVPTAGIKVSYGSTLPSSGMAAGDVFIKTS